MDYVIFKLVSLGAFGQFALKYFGVIKYSWWIAAPIFGLVVFVWIFGLGYIIWDNWGAIPTWGRENLDGERLS